MKYVTESKVVSVHTGLPDLPIGQLWYVGTGEDFWGRRNDYVVGIRWRTKGWFGRVKMVSWGPHGQEYATVAGHLTPQNILMAANQVLKERKEKERINSLRGYYPPNFLPEPVEDD